MTTVDTATHTGYFSDPYPIHLAPWMKPFLPQAFSGTTKEILSCPGKLAAACFNQIPFTVTVGDALKAQAKAMGTTITDTIENNNIYQDQYGQYQMATTLFVKNPTYPNASHWNVIVHAHATDPYYPTAWIADTVLVGTFARPTKANYDGKYFEDNGKLYLIYSKRLTTAAPAHDGIVAQLMESPTQVAAGDPTILLQPDDANGGFNSEYFFVDHATNAFKLIETGNITQIDGKYVMAYSTGAYDEPDYKTGLAWSDTLLPQGGASYKKILKLDTAGVWGQPDHEEVQYLLQAQKPAWPNFVASQVIAPGVPSVVQDEKGAWYLFFAAYLPGDSYTDSTTGLFKPDFRRPFFVKLNVNIPADTTVANTPNMDLAGWITTVTQ